MLTFGHNFRVRSAARMAAFGLLLSGLTHCQSTAVISSNPSGVQVYEGDNLLGVTPLTLSLNQLKKQVAGGYLLSVRAAGYSSVNIWIPSWFDGLDLSLNLLPFEVSRLDFVHNVSSHASRREVYQLTAQLLQLQNNVLNRTNAENTADTELSKLLESNPDLGSLHFLKAVVLLQKNNETEAKQFLDRATKLSPREYDFLTLYNLVDGKPIKAENR